MSKKIFICVALVFAAIVCKADTISYWHVYLNEIKIQEYNQNSQGRTIVLKISDLKQKDRITVHYHRDTHCDDCGTTLSIEDAKQHVVSVAHGKGIPNPISFSLGDLLKVIKPGREEYFEVYFFENGRTVNKRLLFRIKLE